MNYTTQQLSEAYIARTAVITAQCAFSTDLVGGQPADESGVAAYVKHHLKLEGDEATAAVKRIMAEEIGERETTPETGELEAKLSYGINVIRRTEHGPWIGNWMVKACFKQAASRLRIFKEIIGTKGDMAEAGQVSAVGISLVEADHPERIYLRAAKQDKPASTYWRKFMGRVQTPRGEKSIIHDSECADAGSRFAFQYRLLPGKLKEDDLRDICACAMIVGLGSAKALECGKFSMPAGCTINFPNGKKAQQ